MSNEVWDLWSRLKSYRWYRESKRVFWFFLLIVIILLPEDSGKKAILWSMAVFALTVVTSHLARKLLFPYVDLETFVKKSLETSTGAAVVAAAVIYFLSVLLQAMTVWLK